jgi:hypothetical protein
MKSDILVLHDEVASDIGGYIKQHFPQTNVSAHTRIDKFLDSARLSPVDLVVLELVSDYRNLSGVRDRIDSPLDLFPILKKLGIENLIAHTSIYTGKDQEEQARQYGATDFIAAEWSPERKNKVYSKYLI